MTSEDYFCVTKNFGFMTFFVRPILKFFLAVFALFGAVPEAPGRNRVKIPFWVDFSFHMRRCLLLSDRF